MKNKIRHILALSFLLLAPCSLSHLQAQSAGTVSTYSRFGLGLLHDQSQGFNKSMGGAGIGVRIGNRINATNPAAYSAIDSLSLILDVGMNASFGQMTQGSQKKAIKNATLDYVHAGMHIAKRMGLVIGYMPYTDINYDFSSTEKYIANDVNTTQPITTDISFEGQGGLNQAYLGLGWRAFHNLSIGANVGFLWGEYDHTLMPVYKEGGTSSSYYNSIIKYYHASMKTYKIDFGAQYPIRLSKQDGLNLGVTIGLGHKIAQDAKLLLYSTQSDTTTYTATSPFDLPLTFGFGGAWMHKNTLLVAGDVRHERWGKCRMPVETATGYEPMKGCYMNRTKVAVGAQWTPDPYNKAYWKRVQYRAGFNYSTPYLKINELDGPKEFSLSVGAGLPISNKHNNRSVVNFGLQWLNRSASSAGLVKENYLVLNLGVTFNERWFMKYKIE